MPKWSAGRGERLASAGEEKAAARIHTGGMMTILNRVYLFFAGEFGLVGERCGRDRRPAARPRANEVGVVET